MAKNKLPPILPTEPITWGETRRKLEIKIMALDKNIKNKNPQNVNDLISLQINKIEQLLRLLADRIDGTEAPSF